MNGASGQCRRVASSRIERAVGVDGEIGERLARGPVVRRLGRGVDHERDVAAVAREQPVHGVGVADVGVDVAVAAARRARAAARRQAVLPSSPKKYAAHVVVDADDVEALAGEEDAPPPSRSARPHPVMSTTAMVRRLEGLRWTAAIGGAEQRLERRAVRSQPREHVVEQSCRCSRRGRQPVAAVTAALSET